jgi:hypothetical protein
LHHQIGNNKIGHKMISFRFNRTSTVERAGIARETPRIIIVDTLPALERMDRDSGIIIVDTLPASLEAQPGPLELTVRVERLDFEFSQSRMALVNIDQTPLTPQVFEDTTGFNFDPTKQQLDILDREGGPALTVDTSRDTALISVNFKTSTITAYVEAQNAAPGTNDPMTNP